MANNKPERLDSIEAYCYQAEYFFNRRYIEALNTVRGSSSYWFAEILKSNKIRITDARFRIAMRFYRRICTLAFRAGCVSRMLIIKSIIQKFICTYPLNVVTGRKIKN